MYAIFTYFFVFLVAFIGVSEQFNLPKFTPKSYQLQKQDETQSNFLHILVNHLTASKNVELNNHNMYDFFNKHIHMCKSEKPNGRALENLGSILLGDRIYQLPFTQSNEVSFGIDVACQKICTSKITQDDAKFIDDLIINEYQYQWFIDDLPIGKRYNLKVKGGDAVLEYYTNSFDMGYYDHTNEKSEYYNKPLIYNHFDIVIEYSEHAGDEYVIVGATVTPLSIKRNTFNENSNKNSNYCSFTGNPKELSLDTESMVDYTISLKYNIVNNITYEQRWDKYLAFQKLVISSDWNNLFILLGINFAFSIIIYNIVMWNMNKYKQQTNFEKTLDMEFDDDQGWKLLLGDIYRQPIRLSLLCCLVGSGIHIMVTCLIITVLGSLGLLSPENRGIVATIAILIFTLLPGVTSFVSMKLYLFYDGRLFKRNMALNCCLVPFIAFGLLLSMNIINVVKLPSHIHSPSVIPLKTLLVFVPLWIFIYVPSSLLGSVVAKKLTKTEKTQRKVNKIQRLIPHQPFVTKLVFISILVSALPFSSLFLVLKHTFTNNVIVDGIIPKEQFVLIGASLIIVAYNCFIMGVCISYAMLLLENWKWCWKVYMSLFFGMFLYIFVYGCLILENYHNFIKYLSLGFLLGLICGSFSFLGGIVCIRKMFGKSSIDVLKSQSERIL